MTSETPCERCHRPVCVFGLCESCWNRLSKEEKDHRALAPNPAEPPACDCWKHERQVCDICQGAGGKDKPQSELPPIDWEQADRMMYLSSFLGDNASRGIGANEARAYLSLKAERDALGMRVGKLLSAVAGEEGRRADLEAENAELRGRVERYEDLIVAWSGDDDARDCGGSCECGYACPHGNGCMAECGCPDPLEDCEALAKEAQAILAARRQEASNG